MSEELTGNILVAQSGGPTAVINSSLAGVITEALNHECIEEIYGGLNGIQGILSEDLIDLAAESQQNIRGLRTTPACALGSCRYQLKSAEDFDRLFQVFETHNIRFFFYIGDNDAMGVAQKVNAQAQQRGYALRVIGIPKSIDNDLAMTDHCPGYGSTVKYLAATIREMALDHEGMGQHDFVSIVEVMGRNAGWISAGGTLARRRNAPEDPPHIVLMPEAPLQPEKFLESVRNVLKKNRHCMVVAAEGLTDINGNYLGANTQVKDGFGHAALGGVADYLRTLVEENLGVKVRSAKFGVAQRTAAHCASLTDADEAYACGQAAVRHAVEGATGKMVALVRGEGEHYSSETTIVELSEVAEAVKTLPAAWISEDGMNVNYQFNKYAMPLIQGEVQVPYELGVPKYVVLECHFIQKQLEAYQTEKQ